MLEELQHTLKGRMSFFRVGTGILEVIGGWGWWCCVMVVVLNLDAMFGISLYSCAPKIRAHASCFESIKLSINGRRMFFIDPSHLRSSFP